MMVSKNRIPVKKKILFCFEQKASIVNIFDDISSFINTGSLAPTNIPEAHA